MYFAVFEYTKELMNLKFNCTIYLEEASKSLQFDFCGLVIGVKLKVM